LIINAIIAMMLMMRGTKKIETFQMSLLSAILQRACDEYAGLSP
jgi:hypothetical protein